MTMTPIRIDFVDFWEDFPRAKNAFTEVLRTRYDVQVCDEPDIVVFSNSGRRHRLYRCPRIFYSGEAVMPDFRHCDYALTPHYLKDPRHLRLPLYALYASPGNLLSVSRANPGPPPQRLEEPKVVQMRKSRFCSFVVGNVGRKAQKRVEFFHRLNRYKQVDSGGRALNNIGGPIPDGSVHKLAFLQPYKFNIAFENQSIAGYTTEKIYEALLARCIPIYWGNPRIQEEFNPNCFLNYFDFPSETALVERIIEIDRNDALHLEYLRQPWFLTDQPNEFFGAERLLDFFERVFTTPIRPVGARRRVFPFGRWIGAKKERRQSPAIWNERGQNADH